MTEINFGSTYRIPITQAGVNSAKKAKLKELIQSYPNGLIGNSKVGNARVSMPDKEDQNFIRKLKGIGYKVFQKFEGEDISKENLDAFIKEKLDTRDFALKGKQSKRMSTSLKQQRRYDRNLTLPEKPVDIDENIEEIETIAQKINTPNNKPAPAAKSKVFDRPIKTPDEIRATQGYIDTVNEYGKEFAEAVYFGIK